MTLASLTIRPHFSHGCRRSDHYFHTKRQRCGDGSHAVKILVTSVRFASARFGPAIVVVCYTIISQPACSPLGVSTLCSSGRRQTASEKTSRSQRSLSSFQSSHRSHSIRSDSLISQRKSF